MADIEIKAGPKCPNCKVEGIEFISSNESTEQSKGGDPWFNVAFCNQCGHVHGIFNKVGLKPSVKLPTM
jgi:predicted Zn-ribbon and HTH transcriptional regulator